MESDTLGRCRLSILSHQTIKALCQGPNPLVRKYNPARIRSASYDLGLGPEFYLSPLGESPGGPIQTGTLGAHARTLEIPQNQVVLIRTAEDVAVPNNLVAHLSLKLDVLLTGLIMASQSQVDAGYRGPIYALLYNLSDEAVTLHQDQAILRIEFATLDEETEQPYAGDYRPSFTLADVIPHRITSSLSGFEEDMNAFQHRVQEHMTAFERQMQRFRSIAWAAIIGTAVAVGAIIISLLGPLQNETSDAKAVSNSTAETVQGLRQEVSENERQFARMRERLRRLNREINSRR